jgi:hypothetical protein
MSDKALYLRARELAEKAVAGPWHSKPDSGVWREARGIYNEANEAIAHTTRGWSDDGEIEDANAAFIAFCRTAAPALAEQIEAAKEMLERFIAYRDAGEVGQERMLKGGYLDALTADARAAIALIDKSLDEGESK